MIKTNGMIRQKIKIRRKKYKKEREMDTVTLKLVNSTQCVSHMNRTITYDYPNKRDRKNDGLGLSSHLYHLFVILSPLRRECIVLFDHQIQPNGKNIWEKKQNCIY